MSGQTNKVVVIYKSKYGSTKRYAEWISDELNADLMEVSKVRVNDLRNYDTIIFGGFLHAVGISGIKVITDNIMELKNNKIIIFAVGCSPEREDAKEQIISSNFKDKQKEKINFFYLRGAFDYNKLDFIDRTMMNALRLKLKSKKKEELDEDSKGLLECYDNPVDWTDKQAITPILECAKTVK